MEGNLCTSVHYEGNKFSGVSSAHSPAWVATLCPKFLPWGSSCNVPPDLSESQISPLHQHRILDPWKRDAHQNKHTSLSDIYTNITFRLCHVWEIIFEGEPRKILLLRDGRALLKRNPVALGGTHHPFCHLTDNHFICLSRRHDSFWPELHSAPPGFPSYMIRIQETALEINSNSYHWVLKGCYWLAPSLFQGSNAQLFSSLS